MIRGILDFGCLRDERAVRRDRLARTVAQHREDAALRPDDPAVRLDLAGDLVRLAHAEIDVGRPDAARSLLEEALAIRQALLDADPSDIASRLGACRALASLASLDRQAGAVGDSRLRHRERLRLARQGLLRDASSDALHGEVEAALFELAQEEESGHGPATARTILGELIESASLRTDPAALSFALAAAARVEHRIGRADLARDMLLRRLELLRGLPAGAAAADRDAELADALEELATLDRELGDVGLAAERHGEALDLRRRLAASGSHHAREQLARLLAMAAARVEQDGQLGTAAALLDEELELRRVAVAALPGDALLRARSGLEIVQALHALAFSLRRRSLIAEAAADLGCARALRAEEVRAWRDLASLPSAGEDEKRGLARALHSSARLAARADDDLGAERLGREALSLGRDLQRLALGPFAPGADVAETLALLAGLAQAQGDGCRAELLAGELAAHELRVGEALARTGDDPGRSHGHLRCPDDGPSLDAERRHRIGRALAFEAIVALRTGLLSRCRRALRDLQAFGDVLEPPLVGDERDRLADVLATIACSADVDGLAALARLVREAAPSLGDLVV